MIGIYWYDFLKKFIEPFQKKLVFHRFTTSGFVVEVDATYENQSVFAFHNHSTFLPSLIIILAGIPETTQLSGTSFTTTELAAMVTLSPMITGPIIVTPVAI